MTIASLSPALTQAVLNYLGVKAARPDRRLLNALLAAYTRKVPWETAFRMVKRAHTPTTADCPRWPVEFWQDAIERGGGGTCFESNYAFFSLLRTLGYKGYLTINDMENSTGDHAAIVVSLNGQKLLVDVGFPVYVPLPINPQRQTQRHSLFHLYKVKPIGKDYYLVKRNRHPQTLCLFLVDKPVAEPVFRTRTIQDYGERGLFLDHLIVSKIVNGQIWRFNGRETPLHLQEFRNGQQIDHPLGDNPAAKIAKHFAMDEAIIAAALQLSAAVK
jgi:arylamine N-acetyltransferase